jgi:hypothetical protein
VSLSFSSVAPAERSPAALDKIHTKLTSAGQPVHSFRTLLADLSTIVRNTCKPTSIDAPSFEKATLPTTTQQHALDLLKVKLAP